MNYLLYKICMFIFLLLSLASGQNPSESKGFSVGFGPTYNVMKTQFYDLNKVVDDAPGYSLEACLRTGSAVRFGLRFWSSEHTLQSPVYTPGSHNFRGYEGYIKLVLLRKLRWRPFFMVSYAKIGLLQKNGDGFRGVGHSFSTGLEYFFSRNISITTEFDLRYIDYQDFQVNHQRMGLPFYNGSMIAFHLLTLYWHFN